MGLMTNDDTVVPFRGGSMKFQIKMTSNNQYRFNILAGNGQVLATFEGVVEGRITDRPRGSHGFGYDPIFIPEGFEETFAELPEEVKNNISHRAKAIRKLQAELPTLCREA